MAASDTGQQTETFILQGGLDLTTTALALPAGRCIAAYNYEAEVRGYRRLNGYERFDGHTKPSEASYWMLNFDAGSLALVAEDAVVGVTSGATGRLVINAILTSGTYGGGNAVGTLVMTDVTGTWADNETIRRVSGAVNAAAANGTTTRDAAPTDALDATYSQAAIESCRDRISAVPGSGPVRGVWAYNGSIWAFRDNAGATAGIMHKSTSAGWVAQSFGHTLDFTLGTADGPFVEGETINGATSGATAVVRRVVLQSGAWSGTAAGYLVVSGITGTFQAAETLRRTTTVIATNTAAQAAITLAPGGIYDFVVHNFYAAQDRRRLYFANGVNRAMEWDGTYLAPIKTGLSDALDKPTHIAEFKEHLFLGYRGGAFNCSSTGEPLTFIAATGAAEFSIGVDVTAFIVSSTALIIFGQSQVHQLTGDDSANFVQAPIADDAGAYEWTAQLIGMPAYMDDQGIRKLQTAQEFGNWRVGTMTQDIEPVFRNKRAIGVTPRCSLRVRAKDQYWLFFSDGTGVILYLGRRSPEPMLFNFPLDFYCACSNDENASGFEEMYLGGSDGMVYELGVGTSFDGEAVTAYLRLPFHSLKSPTRLKRFFLASLEVDATASTTLGMTAEFAYADDDVPAVGEQQFEIRGGGGFWGEANWDEFFWSSPVQGIARAPLDGLGQNVSIAVASEATYEEPHTLSAVTLNYSVRRQIR